MTDWPGPFLMSNDDGKTIPPDHIVDQLYDIALDPGTLEDFISSWNEAGFDASQARQTIEQIDAFDSAFGSHLLRADRFLERNNGVATMSPLVQALAPFDVSAAMVLDHRLCIAALNPGASAAFGVTQASHIRDLPFDADQLALLTDALEADLRRDGTETKLLKLTMAETGRPVLFHMRHLSEDDAEGKPLMLLVSTLYFWKPELDDTLIEVFELTRAELGVVRALVEGRDAKAVAVERGTSEGTVRSQIKSILSKMGAKSQSEVIRLVMSLRDVTSSTRSHDPLPAAMLSGDWLQTEAEKPFKTLTLPDGRRYDYHDQGPQDGMPILISHMGYGQLRWSAPMLKLAFKHGLRVIAPVRAGFGASSSLDRTANVMAVTRDDTVTLLDHLGVHRLPYAPQGNDLVFAVDLAAAHPERVSEIVGICARPCLPGDLHYARMAKWHRFFLSTAKHSPSLLEFTSRAAFSMARKIGPQAMFRNMNKRSEADFRLMADPVSAPIMQQAATEILFADDSAAARAFAMETLASEADWSDRMHASKETPIWSMNGAQDPALDMSTIAEYREHYPWMTFEVIEDAGQMLMFQKYEMLIPRLAEAARRAL